MDETAKAETRADHAFTKSIRKTGYGTVWSHLDRVREKLKKASDEFKGQDHELRKVKDTGKANDITVSNDRRQPLGPKVYNVFLIYYLNILIIVLV